MKNLDQELIMVKIEMALRKCSIEEAYMEYLELSGTNKLPADNAIKDISDDTLKVKKQASGSSGSTNTSVKQTGYLSHFKNALTNKIS